MLTKELDDVLEECARRRLDLAATVARFLPPACRLVGASGARVRALDESEKQADYRWGASGGAFKLKLPLEVSGSKVGEAEWWFAAVPSDRKAARERAEAACEELDNAVHALQTAGLKQRLVEDMGRFMTRRVFDQAVDDAAAALHRATGFKRLALVYLDDEEGGAGHLRYRVYSGKKLAASAGGRRLPAVDRLLASAGGAVLEPGREDLARALGLRAHDAASLVAGVAQPRPIGQALIEASGGLDAFGKDLLQVFANAVTQRLVDYNRERRHLSQFFGPEVIDALVAERDYSKWLSPRVETIAILYADINSFTKICERALKKPARIGAFVDRWSAGAVDLVWKNGGVFDKMVGDCVIAHFGPPFYKDSPAKRIEAAARTALEIQAFTRAVQKEAEFAPLPKAAGLPGLGVAIGLNLCPAAVGLFGPNRDFTAFARGMNETARLQSQAGFRETLVMEPAAKVLMRAKGLRLDGPREAAVKNVGKPLRYYVLS